MTKQRITFNDLQVKFGVLAVAPVFPIPAIGVAAAGQVGHM